MRRKEQLTVVIPLTGNFREREEIIAGLRLGGSLKIGTRFPHLMPEKLVPAVRDLVRGEIIDWRSTQAVSEAVQEFVNTGEGLSLKVLSSVSEFLDEGDRALELLSSDLEGFPSGIPTFQARRLHEWFYKMFVLGARLCWSFEGQAEISPDLMTPQRKRYTKIIEGKLNDFTREIKKAKIEDLSPYLRFVSLFQLFNEVRADNENEKESRIPIEALADNFFSALEQTWRRLSQGWSWKQVKEAVFVLPSLESKIVLQHAVAALESNLLSIADNSKTEENLSELRLEGLARLLRMGREINKGILKGVDFYFPNLREYLQSNLEFESFSVPRKELPSAAITLLTKIMGTSKEEGQKLLTQVNELATKDPKATTSWFLTLLALKHRVPELTDLIDSFITNWEVLPEPIRQIYFNQQPGKIWFDGDSLRPRKPGDNLQSAFPVYTSSAEKVKETEAPKSKLSRAEISLLKTFLTHPGQLPFIGKVDILDQDQIEEFLSSRFKLGTGKLVKETLFDQVSLLQKNWQGNSRSLLFLAGLPGSLKIMQEAQRNDGINAVYLQGSEITFVFGKNNLALTGTLNKDGWLNLVGENEESLLNPENLFLNKLALELATQKLYRSGLVAAYNQADLKSLREALANFNRHPLRTTFELPKLDIPKSDDIPLIPVEVPRFKGLLLIGEK